MMGALRLMPAFGAGQRHRLLAKHLVRLREGVTKGAGSRTGRGSVPAAPDGSTPAMDVAIAATDGAQDSLVKGLQTKGLLALAQSGGTYYGGAGPGAAQAS